VRLDGHLLETRNRPGRAALRRLLLLQGVGHGGWGCAATQRARGQRVH